MKRQFAIIFIGLMAGTILVCWFANNTLLERYYMSSKKEAIFEAYDRIGQAISDGDITSDAFLSELYMIGSKSNISIMVMDTDARIRVCVGAEKNVMQQALLDNLFAKEENKKNLDVYHGENGAYYVLQKVKDPRTNTNFLEMWGLYDNGNFFMLRSSVESIQESVSIANRFLAYVGLIAATLSGVVIWFVSRKVTEPILELTAISERMIHLDFDA